MGAGEAIGGVLPIERELREEQGSALVRVSRRVERLLEQLRVQEQHAARLSGSARTAALHTHERLREEYARYRWYLLIQREAMGLYHHGIIDELYPVVAPLR